MEPEITVSDKDFAAVMFEYCTTKGIKNGGDKDYSDSQKAILKEITRLIRN